MSTSRSSAELTVFQRGKPIGTAAWTAFDRHVEARTEVEIDGGAPIDVATISPGPGELRVAGRILARVGSGSRRIDNLSVRDLLGEIEISLTVAGEDDELLGECRLLAFVAGTKETVEAYETLIADLERLQPRLLREVGGAVRLQRGQELRCLDPAEEARRLQDWLARLDRVLPHIEARPFESLASEHVVRAWQPGDQIASDLREVLTANGTVLRGRRPLRIGTVTIRQTRRSLDVPEHRQLRLGFEQIVQRARALDHYCARVLDAYEVDRRRWGGRADSVDEQRNGARRSDLRQHRRAAGALRMRAAELLRDRRVLAEVPSAVGRLQPTPLWLSRPDYRTAFDVLRELQAHGGAILTGDEFRIRLRGLDQLFEYWCFARTLLAVAETVGQAVESSMFRLIDDVYRPDLQPGIVVRFDHGDGASVSVGYEPSFPPLEAETSESGLVGTIRSALSIGHLRPDIVVRLDRKDQPPRMLVLDAKNRPNFQPDDLWSAKDYRSLLVDPHTGNQPAQWMVYLNRDSRHPLIENLPGFLEGRLGGPRSWYLAALCVLPDQGERLLKLVQRFLAAGESGAGSADHRAISSPT
ncbi:MAG: nuclease domain-containing protein [Planctomycetota bacterium]